MATMLDLFKWKKGKPYIKYRAEEGLLNLTFRGSVAIVLIMRLEGELIDVMGVHIILRIILLSVWISAIGVTIGMKRSVYSVCLQPH